MNAPSAAKGRDAIIAERYLAGETLQAIGDDYGITRERVRQILRNTGVPSLGHRKEHCKQAVPLTDTDRRAAKLYADGLPSGKVAELTGLTQSQVLRAVRMTGGKAAPVGQPRAPDDADVTAEVARLYLSGLGAAEITRRLAPRIKWPERVYGYLKRAGVRPRYERGGRRPLQPRAVQSPFSEAPAGTPPVSAGNLSSAAHDAEAG